jgi:hypothetical protein
MNRQLSLPYVPNTWEWFVYDPHVVSDGNGGYMMFYAAYPSAFATTGQQLGMATSTDGITWTNRQQIGVAGRAPYYFEDVDGTPYLYFSKGDWYREGYEIARMRGTKVVETLIVSVDIKPGSATNCFNQNDRGVIPVAVLGSEDFDVTQINVDSLRLEGLAVKMAGKSNKYLAHIEDVNADGYPDLVLQFQDSDNWVYSGSGTATLTGQLSDGTPIQGSDSICIVP